MAGPNCRFEVHGLDPPDHLFHPLTEFRCAAQAIRNAFEAERGGYDALVIGHFQEPGLLEIRGAVDFPVIGLGEATMLAGLSMGRKLGLVTIDPIFIDWHERQIRAYGLEQRVTGVRAIKVDLPGFMSAFTNEADYSKVRANFVDQVRPLVAAGAEVIIPAGGLPMLLFARERPFVIDGALVLNGIAVVAKAAEMALSLHRLTGSVVSRRGSYAKLRPKRSRSSCAIGGESLASSVIAIAWRPIDQTIPITAVLSHSRHWRTLHFCCHRQVAGMPRKERFHARVKAALARHSRGHSNAMTDAPAQGLGLLAKLVIAAAATLVIAGIVWHGIALDNFQRMWSDLIDRPSGPMAFRFILQPSMAAITATRDGLRDARTERSPYLWTIVRQSEERVALLREGLDATARIILLGLAMDVIYQVMVFKMFYPVEALIIAILLAFVPYLLIRGLVVRVWHARAAGRV